MRVSAASEPALADASNEDWFSASPGLVVVLDGATARTDTGCSHGVSWYAARLGAAVSALAVDPETALTSALSQAIEAVAKQHPECDLTSPGTPSAAIAILRSNGPEVEFLALGDVTIVLDEESGIRTITDERVELTARAERRNADRFPIGSQEKRDALVEMKHAELAARNQPGGFWVAAADPSVTRQALCGSTRRNDLRQCALLTDGAARIVRMFELLDWPEVLRLLSQAGPHELVRRVREVESSDPVGTRWPRNKTSDDATVVLVRSSAESPAESSERSVVER